MRQDSRRNQSGTVEPVSSPERDALAAVTYGRIRERMFSYVSNWRTNWSVTMKEVSIKCSPHNRNQMALFIGAFLTEKAHTQVAC